MKALALQLDQIQDDLRTERLGTGFHYFLELDSTNRYARGLAEQGAAEGEIVIAEEQSRGRGRLGRSWVSPPYVNVYFSVVLRPKLPPARAPQITLMAAVALAETLDAFSPLPALIKWPNDILMNGKKLAGILTESSCHADRIEFAILGIGVNLNFPAELMPDAIRGGATSLWAVRQHRVDREEFLRRLIQHLDRCYGILEESGFEAIARRWDDRFSLRGKQVRVEMVDGVLFGRAIGIDQDGALIIEEESRDLHRVLAGDVMPVEE